MPKKRLHLPLSEWPDLDREAFVRARQPGELFSPDGRASRWAPHSVRSAVKGYGYWLRYLRDSGQFDPECRPSHRASKSALAGYVRYLRERGLAPTSLTNRFRDVLVVLRVVDPQGDLEPLQRLHNNLRRDRRTTRDKRSRLRGPAEVFSAGLARMDHHRAEAASSKTAAAKFGDGLMMVMLATKPVRRRNVAGTILGTHIIKLQNGAYRWQFTAEETKTRQSISADLPLTLTPFIDYWLEKVRPVLLAGGTSDAFWITVKGTGMASDTVYGRFCEATLEELGVRINPHLMRDIVATGIAIAMPQDAAIIPAMLDHGWNESSKDYFKLADAFSASALYLDVLKVRWIEASGR